MFPIVWRHRADSFLMLQKLVRRTNRFPPGYGNRKNHEVRVTVSELRFPSHEIAEDKDHAFW